MKFKVGQIIKLVDNNKYPNIPIGTLVKVRGEGRIYETVSVEWPSNVDAMDGGYYRYRFAPLEGQLLFDFMY